MVTLNKIIVGNSWKWTFRACNFQEKPIKTQLGCVFKAHQVTAS